MMVLSVIALNAGCATVGGDYCALASPFMWQSEAEIDATPARVVRYIEGQAEVWGRVCE